MFGRKKNVEEKVVVDTQQQELSLAVQNAADRAIALLTPQIYVHFLALKIDQRFPSMVTVCYVHEEDSNTAHVSTFRVMPTCASVRTVKDHLNLRYTPFSEKKLGSPVTVIGEAGTASLAVGAIKGYPLNTAAVDSAVYALLHNLVFERQGHVPSEKAV